MPEKNFIFVQKCVCIVCTFLGGVTSKSPCPEGSRKLWVVALHPVGCGLAFAALAVCADRPVPAAPVPEGVVFVVACCMVAAEYDVRYK